MMRCLVTATLAEIKGWTEVVLTKSKGREFNEQCRWMAKQNLHSTIDYIYLPGAKTRAHDARTDIFRFKNSSMATLFKLTFGGS